MAAETIRFKLDENQYELPEIDDLTMDEWQILYDTAGLILEDFAPVQDEKSEVERQRRVGQPNFTRAMLQIAYQRANPYATTDDARQIAGEAKLIRVLESMGENVTEDETNPPESTTKPGESSLSGSVTSKENESDDSPRNSTEPVDRPEPTGMPV